MSGEKPLLTSASTNSSTASDAGMDSELSPAVSVRGVRPNMKMFQWEGREDSERGRRERGERDQKMRRILFHRD
jgi:hypothetical protein